MRMILSSSKRVEILICGGFSVIQSPSERTLKQWEVWTQGVFTV